jgi:hypothetical protein
MKKLVVVLIGLIAVASSKCLAAEPVVVRTGDNLSVLKTTISSTTASVIATWSTGRGALTCLNADTSNTVYLGTSTAVTANGAASFPLYPKQAIQILNNGQLYAIADTGVTSSAVHCITEN